MKASTAVVAVLLASCGGVVPYGSFVSDREPVQAAMATDAAKKLAVSLPEGQPVRFAHDAEDAFGRGLAAELRREGFAIRSTPVSGEVLVRYVVDVVKGTEWLRATIYVQGRAFASVRAARR